jgi:uncharacterized membrane protein
MKRIKWSKLWDSLHSSYWFLPTVMAVAAIALAFAMLAVDRASQENMKQLKWIYTGGPDGARALLSAVAGSMITVAATAFSITIIALQLAASNFGPRLLRNFMQDTGNQLVLGTFIGTFIYCLLILRTVRGEDYALFVPQLSVTVGIVLAIASVAILIYFIHHASTIIQASHVIAGVSHDLDAAIERLFPDQLGHGAPPRLGRQIEETPANFDSDAYAVKASKTGYIQAIDNQELLKIACKHCLLLRLQFRPGQFVVQGSDLVLVYPSKHVFSKLTERLNDVFIVGNERNEQQDVEFPINQLVEVALRAISPAVNDPFTAIRCIDRIGAGLSRLAQQEFPSPYRYDKQGTLRLIAEGITFEALVDSAFNQIRRYAQSDAAVTIRLLEAIATIASTTGNAKQRAALRRHAEMIQRGSREGLSEELDRQAVKQQYDQVISKLAQQSHQIERLKQKHTHDPQG